jgi:hypothetical protein
MKAHEGRFIYCTKSQNNMVRYGVTHYVIFLITLHDISSSDEHMLVIVTKTSIEYEFKKKKKLESTTRHRMVLQLHIIIIVPWQ